MSTKFKSSLKISTGLALSMMMSMPALAQNNQLDEVIVTSTKRSKSVQDVPVTVTVLNADFIATADINDAASIAVNTPGLAYGEFSPGQALYSMRGVGSADDGAGLDNSVAAFLDGVYIGRPSQRNSND